MAFRDNPADKRFELDVDGVVVFAEYREKSGMRALTHFETPEAARGKGAAGKLMAEILADARGRGEKLKALCPYAEDYLGKHPESGDVLSL